MASLTDLPNVGPVLADNLRQIGVETPEQLCAMGSREAFLLIRAQVDEGACLHQLQALEGAVRGIRKTALTKEQKAELNAFFKTL